MADEDERSEPDAQEVRVNFGTPFPLFALDSVALLPHATVSLLVFEARYRQMLEDVLDGAGQIALGVFEGDRWKTEYGGSPPVRPAVCVGQIVQHQRLANGNYRVWIQGVCRARIVEEVEPDERRLYREAVLRPAGAPMGDEKHLTPARSRILELLRADPLAGFGEVTELLAELERGSRVIPTSALLEFVGLTVLGSIHDSELQYRLLDEGDADSRAAIIEGELRSLARTLDRAREQFDPGAPRGITWN